jgi:hypothetical protein
MSTYWEQKRKEPRIPLRLPVVIRGRDTNDAEFVENTFTENVSRSGACVITSHRVNIGTFLEIEAYGTFRNRASVTIVWIDTENPKNYKMGVKFSEPRINWIIK